VERAHKIFSSANKITDSEKRRNVLISKVDRHGNMSVWQVLVWLAALAPLLTAVPTNKLVFLEEPEDVTGQAGGRLELPCRVGGRGRGDELLLDQGRICSWTRDGEEVVTSDGGRVHLAGCSLVLEPLLVADEGEYRCLAGPELTSQPAKVTVEAQPGLPFITEARVGDVLAVEEGRLVELHCSSQGAKPAAELVWRYGAVATEGFDIREEVTRQRDTGLWRTTSVFKFVPREDQEVVCSVHSEPFPEARNSRPLQLKLLHEPRVTVTGPSTQLREGQDITLTCETAASPSEVTYKWFINDNEIIGQAEASLTLEKVGREHHKAEVKCVAENSAGVGEAAVELTVRYEPRILEHPESVVARQGETVSLHCQAEGSPAPQYAWVKVVAGQKEEVVGVSGTLTLTAAERTEGQYVCKVFVTGHPALSSRPASLALLRPPTVEMEETVAARVGEAAVLQCRVTTLSTNTTVVWTRHPAEGRLDSLRGDMTRERRVPGEQGGVTVHAELILPVLAEADFTSYGCFAQNEAGTDYRMLTLMEQQDTDWVSLIVAVNTLLGMLVLAGVFVWHYRRRAGAQLLPTTIERAVLPPIYRGEDMGLFDELDLRDGMTENYGAISNEYFDNPKDEKKIDLRIV
jgi:hypothetical protein